MTKSTSPTPPLKSDNLQELERQKDFVNNNLHTTYKQDYLDYSNRFESALKIPGHALVLPAGVSAASLGIIFGLFAVLFQAGISAVLNEKLKPKDIEDNLLFGLANSFFKAAVETGNYSFEGMFNNMSEVISATKYDNVSTQIPADIKTQHLMNAQKALKEIQDNNVFDDITGKERYSTQTALQNSR